MHMRTASLALAGLLLTGCARFGIPKDATQRGLPSFVKVDEGYYRGGQPTDDGIRRLKAMGIKTIVNLRHHSRETARERKLAESLGMRWVNYPMWFWWKPSDDQIRAFITLFSSEENRPVFVHCRQGWNRVGIMTAIYRIVYHGWTPERAYAEGCKLGLAEWNPVSKHLLFEKVPRELEVDSRHAQVERRSPDG